MIFHEKFFQCLAGAIPLFLTPQKIGLLILDMETFPKYIPLFKIHKECDTRICLKNYQNFLNIINV